MTGVAHVEMTLSVPKSVSVLWAMADDAGSPDGSSRRCLEAAERTVQYMARNKAVVHRRGKDGVRVQGAGGGRGGRVVVACDRAGGRGVIGRRRRSCTSTTWWSA